MKMKVKILGLVSAVLILSSVLALASQSNNEHLLPFQEKSIIDFHAHVAGLGYGNSGCFINDEMRNNFRFKFYLMAMGTSLKELEREGDQVIFKKIAGGGRRNRLCVFSFNRLWQFFKSPKCKNHKVLF